MRLIVRNEKGEEISYDFNNRMVSIGRSAENHLPINDLNSSRHHCEVHVTPDGFELHDRDSRNGTFVNGRRIDRTLLQAGDAIEIGHTVIYFGCLPGERTDEGTGTVEMTPTAASRRSRSSNASAKAPDADIAVSLAETHKASKQAAHPSLPSRARPSSRVLRKQPTEATNVFDEIRQQYERRLHEFKRLLLLNKVLNSELVLRNVLETVLGTVIDISGAERGFLLLNNGDRASITVSRNVDGEDVRDAKDKISRSITREVLASGRPVLLSNASQADDERFAGRESIQKLGLRSVISVPLQHRDKILGALYLDNRFKTDCFTENTLELVEVVADQAAIAITNARLFEENLKQHDELTAAKEELLHLNQLLRDRIQKQDEDLAEARAALAKTRQPGQFKHNFDNIITRSPAMLEILAVIDKITESSVPVLVQGESGTGKELVARALHFNGPRSQGPFVSENCAAIPPQLMESEFFGYVKGAFTGADSDKKGLFELADGGTLFLDEVGDMDLDIQTKLLRVLQDGVLRRIGSKEFQKVDVRILSATNRDLQAMIKDGQFREDLFYRLNVVNVQLPPLRDRKEDLPPLVKTFLQQFADQRSEPPRELEDKALNALLRYDWPGNIRELENEIERAVALSIGRDNVTLEDLSPRVIDAAKDASRRSLRSSRSIDRLTLGSLNLKDLVAQETENIEREVITDALRKTQYKKSQAAKLLGISRPTLDSKIEKYGLHKKNVLTESSR